MSYDFNYKFWVATAKDIENIQLKQKAYEKLKPIEERMLGHEIFAEMYSQYVDLVNKLGYIYSRTFQVQKREIVTKLIEAASNRLIELRNELKNIEFSEFIYIDKTLIQRKLTPEDINLLRPPYFPYWRPRDIQNIIKGPRIIKKIEAILTPEEEAIRQKALKRPKVEQAAEIILTPQQKAYIAAVTLIQIHERARIGRVFKTTIHYQPDILKPPEVPSASKYIFTHKPDQSMLVLIKRTKFDANYFITKKNIGDFNYYVPPISAKIQKFDDDDKTGDDSVTDLVEKSIQIADGDTCDAEPYFIEGMLQKSKSDIKIKSATTIAMLQIQLSNFIVKRSVKIIQRTWRKYLACKEKKRFELKEKILIGMTSERIVKKNPLDAMQKKSDENRTKVEEHQKEFQKACENEKNRILKVKSPWIMEDISDHIRAWFREFYDGAQEFHPYPEEWQGGTILVLTGETLNVREFMSAKNKAPLSKEEKKKISEKKKLEKKKIKQKALKEKQQYMKMKKKAFERGEIYYELGTDFPKSKNLVQIDETMKEYKNEWKFIDEKNNVKQSPFMTWIKSEKFAEVHRELRLTVDELMRIEFELLRKALAKDTKKKYKPQKKKKEKKKKTKKEKKVIDLTKDRTIAELYYEMQDSGLIRNCPRRYFEEFIGDYNYCAYEIRNYFQLDTSPSLIEIKDIFREWILGMGPLNLPKYRSIIIGGPPNSGKGQLCDILASELDAVVIDLSPEVVVQYCDNMDYLLHLVTKMSRILQPTIILIKGIHRVFWKKVPKEFDYLKPTIIEKLLKKKIVKSIKADEKIFVLGTTDEPWSAKGGMNKLFDKIILLPQPDYSSSFILWRTMCLQFIGVPRDYEFSPIAMVARNYNSGSIHDNIHKTINIERRMKFSRRPLHSREFIETYLEVPDFPPEISEFALYQKWFNKANKLAKQRVKYLKRLQAKMKKK